ncbi:hypothetical protein AciM339_1199 [Aciduliprofundum sp. MAR08-339]|uniref:hypothetical protein n=1 Tax=Aciduliprofundum sp. (strain MAR08-339) TaxID=673860 RepID=UPI0002A49FD9|nr:hypothetical protein AciM339_1199 [Aciduliprofundum sp. MAR08-339]
MIEDYILPTPLPEKLKSKFLGGTLKIGEHRSFEGFIVRVPNAQHIRDLLWRSLSPKIGDFTIKGITPFPQNGYPVMPVLIPHWVKLNFSFGFVEGRVYDLSQFSPLHGRFLLVEDARKMQVEKYLIGDAPSLDGGKIYNVFDMAFAESTRDVMLSFFMSSGNYLTRIGGCTVSLLTPLSENYASNFKDIESIVKGLNPILTKNSMRVELIYEEPLKVSIRSALRIKYEKMKSSKAAKFYETRRGREWEKSAITDATVKMENLINSAELAFIPYREEVQVDDSELREYSLDIATYVLHRHVIQPEIDINAIIPMKERIMRKIDSEFPLLSEAMKMGILMDISDVNGFGEHIGRLINSWERLGMGDPLGKVLNIYTILFERIEDALQDRLRSEISALSEKRRFERAINRILWELNVLRPEGWDFFYFERKLEERGIFRNAERIFEELVQKGIVIRKKDKFLAVGQV